MRENVWGIERKIYLEERVIEREIDAGRYLWRIWEVWDLGRKENMGFKMFDNAQ